MWGLVWKMEVTYLPVSIPGQSKWLDGRNLLKIANHSGWKASKFFSWTQIKLQILHLHNLFLNLNMIRRTAEQCMWTVCYCRLFAFICVLLHFLIFQVWKKTTQYEAWWRCLVRFQETHLKFLVLGSVASKNHLRCVRLSENLQKSLGKENLKSKMGAQA